MRLHDIVWSGLSAALGAHDLDSLVVVDIGSDPKSSETQSLMDQLTAATDRAARNFGPEAAVDAAPRALETLAAAVDNVAVALESKPSINYPPP